MTSELEGRITELSEELDRLGMAAIIDAGLHDEFVALATTAIEQAGMLEDRDELVEELGDLIGQHRLEELRPAIEQRAREKYSEDYADVTPVDVLAENMFCPCCDRTFQAVRVNEIPYRVEWTADGFDLQELAINLAIAV